MGKASAFAYLLLAAPLVLAGCEQPPAQEPAPVEAPADTAATTTESPILTADATDEQIIASAESAAPAAVAREATIVAVGADGQMREVRKGSSMWTCMADNPQTPSADPMCGDPNAMEWAQAWMSGETPPEGKVGFMYMLAGGADSSNTDPTATQPAEGRDWIKVGPHVMVMNTKGLMSGYPGGEDPDPSKPYVMWEGTPYEHLMIPVS